MSHSGVSTREEKEAGDRYDRLQNQKELARLRKELRDRGREHALYKEATNKLFLRDEKEMTLLEKENAGCRITLENAQADCYLKRDATTLGALHGKLDEGRGVRKEIKAERERLEEGKAEISQMEKTIKAFRQKTASLKGGNLKKKISITEARLDKATKEFSKKVAVNKKNRASIRSLRLAQTKFTAMHTKMRLELDRVKWEIHEEEDACKDSFRQREEYVVKRRALAEREDREALEFVSEKANLQRTITHDTNFRKFVHEKSKNIEHRQVQAEKTRREKEQSDRIKSAQHRIDEFERAFRRIVDITKVDDVDVIVDQFLKYDAQMFSMFTYAGELERQVGEHEHQIQTLKEKKVMLEEEFRARETERKAHLRKLDEQYQKTQEENVELDKEITMTTKRLAELLERAQESYNRLSEKDDALTKLLEGDLVTYRNALIYLGELERRADKLLYYYRLRQDRAAAEPNVDGEDSIKADGDQFVVTRVADLPPTQTPIRFIDNIPDYKSDSESSDDENADILPLTAEDIKQNLLSKM